MQHLRTHCNGHFPPHPESKLEDKLFTILDLQADMALLAAELANGGSIAPFLVPKEILDQLSNDGKIRLLQLRQDDLKSRLETMTE